MTCDSFIITNNKTRHHSDSAFNQILKLKILNYRTIRLDWKVRPAPHLSKIGTDRCDDTSPLTSSLTYVFFVLFLFLGSGFFMRSLGHYASVTFYRIIHCLIMCVSTSTCANLPLRVWNEFTLHHRPYFIVYFVFKSSR